MTTETQLTASLVENVINQYIEAFNNSDVKGIMKTFSADAIVMANGFPTVRGKENIEAMYRMAFQSMRCVFTNIIDEINVKGPMVVVITNATGSTTNLATNEETPLDPHRGVYVLDHEEDDWLIKYYIFNLTSS